MLNLNDLYLFARIAEHRGLATTARALGMAKSSLSDRLSALEAYLGVKLVQRNSRQFSLTGAGQRLAEYALAMTAQARAGEMSVRAMLAEPTGELRLTASPATAASGLLAVVADYQRLHPAVVVRLHIDEAPLDLLSEELDLAVRAHEKPLPDSNLVGRYLGFSRRALVASPGYLKRHRVMRDAQELEGHVRLTYRLPSMRTMLWRLRRTDGRTCVLDNARQTAADEVPALRVLALAGAGIAALPLGLCQADLRDGRLIRVLPDWHAGGSHITLLRPCREGQPTSVRALCDHLVRMLPEAMQLDSR